ncbi:hypothetical protein EDD86DRAFT_203286 [Gorgonomyces haynaldii]|nr:hypothetical protein EDD86DRAFT_203286 [Gorgonomyces haynaldii]
MLFINSPIPVGIGSVAVALISINAFITVYLFYKISRGWIKAPQYRKWLITMLSISVLGQLHYIYTVCIESVEEMRPDIFAYFMFVWLITEGTSLLVTLLAEMHFLKALCSMTKVSVQAISRLQYYACFAFVLLIVAGTIKLCADQKWTKQTPISSALMLAFDFHFLGFFLLYEVFQSWLIHVALNRHMNIKYKNQETDDLKEQETEYRAGLTRLKHLVSGIVLVDLMAVLIMLIGVAINSIYLGSFPAQIVRLHAPLMASLFHTVTTMIFPKKQKQQVLMLKNQHPKDQSSTTVQTVLLE